VEVGDWTLDRVGLFILQADIPDSQEYKVGINVSPEWRAPGDARDLTVNLSMLRLVPRD